MKSIESESLCPQTPYRGYNYYETILAWTENTLLRKAIIAIASRKGFRVFDATRSHDRNSWIAVPHFVRVVDYRWYWENSEEIRQHHDEFDDKSVDIVVGSGIVGIPYHQLLYRLSAIDEAKLEATVLQANDRASQLLEQRQFREPSGEYNGGQ